MSSRWSSIYARTDGTGPFFLIEETPDSPPFEDRDLEGFSREHGDVIYLAEAENVGFVHFEHWCNGQLLRRLKYSDDGSWLCAVGDPEAWEATVLFTPECLEKTLKGYDPDQHETIRKCWQRQRIQEGDLFPVLGLVDFVGGLRKSLDLSDAAQP